MSRQIIVRSCFGIFPWQLGWIIMPGIPIAEQVTLTFNDKRQCSYMNSCGGCSNMTYHWTYIILFYLCSSNWTSLSLGILMGLYIEFPPSIFAAPCQWFARKGGYEIMDYILAFQWFHIVRDTFVCFGLCHNITTSLSGDMAINNHWPVLHRLS